MSTPMNTPLFNFSPRFPWSGDVIQDIDPQTSWFFGAIAPEAGSARMERHIALDVMSYGKQLSVLMDAMAELIERGAVGKDTGRKLLDRHARIKQAKDAATRNHLAEARETLARLARVSPEDYAKLLGELQAAAAPASGAAAPAASRPAPRRRR